MGELKKGYLIVGPCETEDTDYIYGCYLEKSNAEKYIESRKDIGKTLYIVDCALVDWASANSKFAENDKIWGIFYVWRGNDMQALNFNRITRKRFKTSLCWGLLGVALFIIPIVAIIKLTIIKALCVLALYTYAIYKI